MTDLTGPEFVSRLLNSDLVDRAETAVALAEVLMRCRFGEEMLARQKPLTARDDGRSWTIEGSLNADRSREGPGRVMVRIEKADARILSLMFDQSLHPPPNPPRDR